jgi:hypothetical protein
MHLDKILFKKTLFHFFLVMGIELALDGRVTSLIRVFSDFMDINLLITNT